MHAECAACEAQASRPVVEPKPWHVVEWANHDVTNALRMAGGFASVHRVADPDERGLVEVAYIDCAMRPMTAFLAPAVDGTDPGPERLRRWSVAASNLEVAFTVEGW